MHDCAVDLVEGMLTREVGGSVNSPHLSYLDVGEASQQMQFADLHGYYVHV